MNAVIVTITVDEKRQITVDIPQNIPIGTTLNVILETPSELQTIDDVRAILAQAGKLAEMDIDDDEMEDISDAELVELGRLPPDAPSSLDLINEDRGTY